jgi:hypothetical protein
MSPATPKTHAPLDPDRIVERDHSSDLGRYRRTCREVDRLLDQGKLSEALRLNDEARALFRSLFAAGELS